jgi:thiol-disulfide isomerase/thioredoxin
MVEREIMEELEIDDFKELRKSIGNKVLIVKFSAEWCKPCQKIKNFVHEQFVKMPENVVVVDIDIDETMDLYMAFRNKKMLNGVPSILAFYGDVVRDNTHWYVTDASISGSDESSVGLFFDECAQKAKTLQ